MCSKNNCGRKRNNCWRSGSHDLIIWVIVRASDRYSFDAVQMMNKKKREKTTILSSAGEGEKEITWNSVINPKKTVVAVCSFYTDLSQMLVNSILNGLSKKSIVS